MVGTEDGDIDAETLQAQIEMSMAYTQELVSSWMKSSKGTLPPSKSRRDEEKELEEYMRRPPRLGVGAAAPESSMQGRDAAQLKNKLTGNTGKKRARDEKDIVTVPSEDEEESRAGAIRKKAKVDPFGPRSDGKGKKAKKGQVNGVPPPSELPAAGKEQKSRGHAEGSDLGLAGVQDAGEQDTHVGQISDSPRKKKKKKHVKAGDDAFIDLTASPLAMPEESLVRQVVNEPGSSSLSTPHIKKHSKKSMKIAATSGSVVSDSPYGNVSHEPHTPSSSVSSRHHPAHNSPSEASQQPIHVLNLDGPPEGTDDMSPKKKRKRRKKGKKRLGADGNTTIELDDES